MLKEKKQEVVTMLTEEFGATSTMIVADPRGLTVAQITDLRVKLRANDATLRVTKNTLARIAAEASGRSDLVELLKGPTAIALCRGDVAATAKVLADFGRSSGKLELRGAYMDGALFDTSAVQRLATLPPKEQLQAQLLGTVVAPMQAIVSVLAAGPRDLVVVLDQIIRKRQEEGAAAA